MVSRDFLLRNVDSSVATKILQSSVNKAVNEVCQNISGDLNEKSAPILARFCQKLQQSLINHCQIWANDNIDGNIPVLPDNTKYYTKIGDYTFIVLENKPQVRSLIVSEKLLDGCPDPGDVDTYYRRTGIPVALSLPYTIFIVVFYNNQYKGLYVAYRNQPLQHINDQLYFANLPNIGTGGLVCMGQDFHPPTPSTKIASQVDVIISTWWQSLFNLDYTTHYLWATHTEPKLETMRKWHTNSKSDPLFVLKVNWRPWATLSGIINEVGAKNSQGNKNLSSVFQNEMNTAVRTVANELAIIIAASNPAVKEKYIETKISEKIKDIVCDLALGSVAGLEQEWATSKQKMSAEIINLRAELDRLANELETTRIW